MEHEESIDLANEADQQLDLANEAISEKLDWVVWYSREGCQFIGSRAEYHQFVLSGE